MRYTQKQIDKYHRQKYIAELEKIAKNLFRMFRDVHMDAQSMIAKLDQLKKKLDEKTEVQLDSEYHRQLKIYIQKVYEQICISKEFNDVQLNEMREAHMTQLNRLQKLKNGISYKKEKHKAERHNQDWG
ncbi:MAG TPA: hypothetical protein CFH81_06455 [Sulfurovum sp. UBA12169]|nr:MAG TPA: hypothetical protein CFH81_06455 [Sulfurovum sp. UBA12169]